MSNGYTPADPAVIAALQGTQAATEALQETTAQARHARQARRAGSACSDAGQADRAGTRMAGDPCTAQVKHGAGEPVSGQWRIGWVLDPAPSQADEAQPRTPDDDARLQEAVL